MTTHAASDAIFPILIGMVLVWFVLIKLLFARLERGHAEKYDSMGRPSLFLRNNIATGLATLKFIIRREHRGLNDRYLSNLSDFMLAFAAIYMLLLVGFALLSA